jgi:hypothetical protein
MIPKIPTEGIAPKDYTVEQFDADILEIVLQNLETVNPQSVAQRFGDPINCVYLRREDEQRCLIGTWLHARGHEYDPAWDSGGGKSAFDLLPKLDYPTDVASRAGEIQTRADNDNDPVPWGTLLKI